MASNYNTRLPHLKGYPGDRYYYIICDVCGKKMRAKDAIKITDKFNLLNGLLVCKEDADETNPQSYLKARSDKELREPTIVRSEGTDSFVFIDTVDQIETGDTTDPTGRAPSAPKNLTIQGTTDTTIDLVWFGPDDPGSSVISGYKIERESPVGGGFSTVVTTTDSVATSYTDTGLSASTVYNYKVSAINNAGTSGASNEASRSTSAS